MPLPNRTKDRSDMELANCKKSNTDAAAPARAKPVTEKPLPTRANVRMENELPSNQSLGTTSSQAPEPLRGEGSLGNISSQPTTPTEEGSPPLGGAPPRPEGLRASAGSRWWEGSWWNTYAAEGHKSDHCEEERGQGFLLSGGRRSW